MEIAQLDYLVSDDGHRLLVEADAAYGGEGDALAASSRLRARFDADDVAAALTQVRLRRRGAEKFGADAGRMFFTQAGLEQASHRLVAQHRASRARRHFGVGATLLDLGCGIGGDLIAFGHGGFAVSAVDVDELTARIAAANAVALGIGARVGVGAAESASLDGFDLLFADPARRTTHGRVFDPDSYSPPWSFVESLLARTAVVKAAPGLPHERVHAGVEAEWVSLDGQLREVCLWSGGGATTDRRATLLRARADGPAPTLTTEDDPGDATVAEVGRYVYEPDDAVIRAHLVTAVSSLVDGWLLDPHLAYVSSDAYVSTPFAAAFEVIDVLPFKEKSLRAALRARDIGALTIKKRGIAVAPEDLRRRLGLRGRVPATIMLTRTPNGAAALLVEPIAPPSKGEPVTVER